MDRRGGYGFLVPILLVLALTAAFAFAPLVRCRRCDQNGLFEGVVQDRRGRFTVTEYCDCGTYFAKIEEGKLKIPLLKASRAPRPLDFPATGDRYWGRGKW